jgi:hypothetical protein
VPSRLGSKAERNAGSRPHHVSFATARLDGPVHGWLSRSRLHILLDSTKGFAGQKATGRVSIRHHERALIGSNGIGPSCTLQGEGAFVACNCATGDNHES